MYKGGFLKYPLLCEFLNVFHSMLADCCLFRILKVQCTVHPSWLADHTHIQIHLSLLCSFDSSYSFSGCNTERVRQMSESFFESTVGFKRQKWKTVLNIWSPRSYLYLFTLNFFIVRSVLCMKWHDYFNWCLAIPLCFNYWIRGRHWGWTRDFCHFFSKCLTSRRVQLQTAAAKPM